MFARKLAMLAAAALTLWAGTACSAALTVVVNSVEQPEGSILLALYDAPEGYAGNGKPVRSTRIAVTGTEVSTTIDDLPPGRYAIKLYHDANDNGQLDTNVAGLPIEAYGFSGTGGRFGPPPFENAAFEIIDSDANEVVIQLR